MARNETLQGWTSQVNERGTLDILLACALTIILCCWTSVCVNVPSLRDNRWDRLRDKCFLAFIGILGPDYLMVLAAGQWESARRSVRKFNAAKLTTKRWTMRQAFFADMGGYLLQVPDLQDPFPIHAEQLYFLVSEGYVKVPSINEADINDKNKRDGLARLLTVIQAFVFGASTLARFSQHLAVSSIEITTLAFIFADIATSCFWTYKPQDITRPVILESDVPMADILRNADVTSPDDYQHTPLDFLNHEAWFCSVFWTDQLRSFKRIFGFSLVKTSTTRPVDRLRSDDFPPLYMLDLYSAVGLLIILYCSIFLSAWNNQFPSQAEHILWRVASVFTAVIATAIMKTDYCLSPASLLTHRHWNGFGVYCSYRAYNQVTTELSKPG